AYVDGSTVNATAGDVEVEATATPTIETLAGGIAAAGTAAAARSVSINLIENDVEAYLNSASIGAPPNVSVLADSNNTLKSYGGTLSGGLAVGVGGTVVVNYLASKTEALVEGGSTVFAEGLDGATINVKGWNTDDQGTERSDSVQGLAVVAST